MWITSNTTWIAGGTLGKWIGKLCGKDVAIRIRVRSCFHVFYEWNAIVTLLAGEMHSLSIGYKRTRSSAQTRSKEPYWQWNEILIHLWVLFVYFGYTNWKFRRHLMWLKVGHVLGRKFPRIIKYFRLICFNKIYIRKDPVTLRMNILLWYYVGCKWRVNGVNYSSEEDHYKTTKVRKIVTISFNVT